MSPWSETTTVYSLTVAVRNDYCMNLFMHFSRHHNYTLPLYLVKLNQIYHIWSLICLCKLGIYNDFEFCLAVDSCFTLLSNAVCYPDKKNSLHVTRTMTDWSLVCVLLDSSSQSDEWRKRLHACVHATGDICLYSLMSVWNSFSCLSYILFIYATKRQAYSRVIMLS